ncbi:MAG: dynamin family protein [Caldimonas sp.]
MAYSFAHSLDALAGWRAALRRRLDDLAQFLGERDLAEGVLATQIASMRERIGNEKLVLAFVAEFSRGKSELINAIFFADTGKRILPATPGRTTMCPVELGWNGAEPPGLALLPIDTRLEPTSLAEFRRRPSAWRRVPLRVDDADQLATTLLEVTRTQWVSCEQARALGFWDDDRPDDNPPTDAQGRVEVPAWRHASINYPHPLLKQGLVVLDTPGLNAIGAEPELTLSLLPTAHATVFILGADTGVTRSDMTIWRDHLGGHGASRFVVLNKIDALEDPLLTAGEVEAHIATQQRETATALDIDVARVFPLSARRALASRVTPDDAGLRRSRLPELEVALSGQLLPRRRAVLEQAVLDGTGRVDAQVARQIGDARRQLAEQMLELRGLRGSNGVKVRMMLQRVDAESAEFEQSGTLLQALRSVHARQLKGLLADLSSERLRSEVDEMQRAMKASLLHIGSRKAFAELCQRLQALLVLSTVRSVEMRDMLAASFARLNAEFGFSLVVVKPPETSRYADELRLIEANYVRYLGLTLALRLSQPRFMEQFRMMLVSKLRVVFENLGGDIELWNKSTSAQIEAQLRERRRAFKHRRDTLERIQGAAGELESRIGQIELQDQRLLQSLARVRELTEAMREQACATAIEGLDVVLQSPRTPADPAEQSVDLLLFDEPSMTARPAHV